MREPLLKQYRYEDLPELDEATLYERRERVFLVLSGLFLGTLAMLNILGTSRFLDLSFELPGFGWHIPMPIAVGTLPYPITFLCTDFISELYGRRRANAVVLMGLVLNLWIVAFVWLGGVLPGKAETGDETAVFFEMQELVFANVAGSMIAYLAAQLVDVQLFHFWKRITKGRYLWLRNNGSTLFSQLLDTTLVVVSVHLIAGALPLRPQAPVVPQIAVFVAAGYTFKLVVALIDTVPFYVGAHGLARYLRLAPPTADPAHEQELALDRAPGAQ